jgi:predicted AlkP superfamily phosphohydrolase/phosphomutase
MSWRTALVALLGIVPALAGCDGAARQGRVLLIGLDGASPKVVRKLLAEGELPNLGRIAQRGLHAPLRSFLPLQSPRIWASVATGKVPKKHGILTFTTGGRLALSSDRRAHALWNIASSAGLRVAVVNWWNTFPPEEIRGVMASDHLFPREVKRRRALTGAHVPSAELTYPAEWTDRLAPLLRNDSDLTSFSDPFSDREALPPWAKPERLSEAFRADASVVRIALEIQQELEPDLTMVLLTGIDRVSHRLWGCLEPADAYPEHLRPSAAQRRAGVRALFDYYRYSDALVGLLLRAHDPEDLVLVVSDHGFEGGTSNYVDLTGSHESEKSRDGVLFASGRGVSRAQPKELVTVNDVTPTVLAWLGLPLGRDMDGRPAGFLETGEPEWIDTHDTTPIRRLPSAASEAEDDILELLRELGYVE